MSRLVKPNDRLLTPHEIALMVMCEMGYGEMTLDQAVEMVKDNEPLARRIEARFEEEVEEENKRGWETVFDKLQNFTCSEDRTDA